jgi:endonuclease YncB( thermonuclease family)
MRASRGSPRPHAAPWRGVGSILITLAAASSCAGASAVSPPPTASLPSGTAGTAVEVLDGDTLRVSLGGTEDTVRLVGVNAPEEGECWSDEATGALGTFVGAGTVLLERDVSDRDAYGRLLRYVITTDGRDMGGALIDGGHAIARSYPPDTARDAEYRELQASAREAGLGLWARDACGDGSWASIDPASIVIEVHPDAAGDDSRNLNDEWVRFANRGAEPLDLSGWLVRDESSTHRYRFVGLVLPAGATVTLHSGCGVDTDSVRYWCVRGSAIWNNSGDTVFLLDPAGNVVTQLGYQPPHVP